MITTRIDGQYAWAVELAANGVRVVRFLDPVATVLPPGLNGPRS